MDLCPDLILRTSFPAFVPGCYLFGRSPIGSSSKWLWWISYYGSLWFTPTLYNGQGPSQPHFQLQLIVRRRYEISSLESRDAPLTNNILYGLHHYQGTLDYLIVHARPPIRLYAIQKNSIGELTADI